MLRSSRPAGRSRGEEIAPSWNRAGAAETNRLKRTRWRCEQGAARVSAVIPALNEAANLPHVFARLPLGELFEVIVVDGRSSDDTIAMARALHPRVRIILQRGRGKGDALACGFAAARGEIIVMLDADGSTDPAEIPRYLDCLFEGADFAKGSRFTGSGGSADITPWRRAGNWALNWAVNTLFGTEYTDLCYGYNAFWTEAVRTLNICCDGFEVETLMNVRAAKAGLTVREVPSLEHERIHGTSKLHPIRDGLRILRTVLRERLRADLDETTTRTVSYRELMRDEPTPARLEPSPVAPAPA